MSAAREAPASACGGSNGLTFLRRALAQPAASLEAACDTILEALLPADRPHDDVAVLPARTRALARPAGPRNHDRLLVQRVEDIVDQPHSARRETPWTRR